VSLTSVSNRKNLQSENFYYLFKHLWVEELTVCSLILFKFFVIGVNDTSGKFATGVIDTGGAP
jgi:hypothetical protein